MGFQRLFSKTAPILEACGLTSVIVRTNVQKFPLQNWEHCFGANVAAVLQQFSDSHGYGMIGSSEPYSHPLVSWGSGPATDYLLSGDAMEIVHEGAGYSRTEKVELIARYPVAAQCLNVCWEGPNPGRNCGTCEKCVRTRLNFLAIGLAEPGCFGAPFDLRMVDSLRPRNAGQLTELGMIRDYAASRDVKGEWIDRLRRRLSVLWSQMDSDLPSKADRCS